ncbi:hypothetical protein QCA50_012788 [Cerrena zonata]|uniref:Uncharacterized protein n=1 Tax=Cerrena zonata TaxID=2478898 RepID=A0AAW0G184_9APHY
MRKTSEARLAFLRKIISEEKGYAFVDLKLAWGIMRTLSSHGMQYENIRSGCEEIFLIIMGKLAEFNRVGETVDLIQWGNFLVEIKEKQLQLEDECTKHIKELSNLSVKDFANISELNKEEITKISRKYVEKVKTELDGLVDYSSKFITLCYSQSENKGIILKFSHLFEALYNYFHESRRLLQVELDRLQKQANSSTTGPKPIQESAESSSTVKDVYNENNKSNNDLTSGHDTLGDNLFVSDKINKPMDSVLAGDTMENHNQVVSESLKSINDPSVSAEVKIQRLRKHSIFLKDTLNKTKEMHEGAIEMVISQLDVFNEQFLNLKEPDNFANAVNATTQDRLVLLRNIISEEKGEVFANAESLLKIEKILTQQSNQYQNIRSGYYDNHLVIVRDLLGIFRDNKPVNKPEWETIKGEVNERHLQLEDECIAHTKQISKLFAKERSY